MQGCSRRISIIIFKNALSYYLGRLAVETELGFDELLDDNNDGADYGEGRSSAVPCGLSSRRYYS